MAHIYKRKEKSNARRDVRCSGILITCLATLSLVVAIVVVVVVVVAFILYTKLIENSRDAVCAHQRRGNIYSQLDKVQRRRAHVHSANRSGFFAWFLESWFDRVDVNFQNIFPEQLRKVGDGNDGEFEDRMPEHSFEEDEAKEGKSVAVLRRLRKEEDWGENSRHFRRCCLRRKRRWTSPHASSVEEQSVEQRSPHASIAHGRGR